ncbi:MAG: DUF488 domain-containing protein [Dysgonamonadaceae bacterium]|jgi:uncharacterized protein (DUF488 family)|nr:DUF488 domain-containing protein [Dysgonamonadaceae bacterium]
MISQTVFSIGHGNKTIEEFVSELHSYGIRFLIDIRSKPYSKYSQHFSQQPLKAVVEREHIKYVYMGEKLGGLPTHDSSCFTYDGKVDYDKLKEKDYFKEGLQRLISANSKGIKVCIMCSESDPKMCHRSKLIGVELHKTGVELQHIIGISKILTQSQVINELTKGFGLVNLFGEEENLTSRKAYLEI